MISPRFLALPVIALTVIVALAQAHNGADARQTDTPTVHRAVSCVTTDTACAFATHSGSSMVR